MRIITKLAAVAALSIVMFSATPAAAQAVRHCDLVQRTDGSYFSPRGPQGCNDAELREDLEASGFSLSNTNGYFELPLAGAREVVTHQQAREEAREDQNYALAVEDHRDVRAYALDVARADAMDRIQGRCEGRALTRSIIGAVANGLASRISRYGTGYYGGNNQYYDCNRR